MKPIPSAQCLVKGLSFEIEWTYADFPSCSIKNDALFLLKQQAC